MWLRPVVVHWCLTVWPLLDDGRWRLVVLNDHLEVLAHFNRLEVADRLSFKLHFGDDTFRLAHFLVFQVEFVITHAVKSLLLSLSLESFRQQIIQHVLDGLVTDTLTIGKLLLLRVDLGAQLLALLGILLAVGGGPVLLTIVRVVPKLSNEYLPSVLITRLLPILGDDMFKLGLLNVSAERIVSVDIEPFFDLFDGGVAVNLLDFVEAVDDAFELLFADGGHVDGGLRLQPFAVFYREFVVFVREVEVDVLLVHVRDLLHVSG